MGINYASPKLAARLSPSLTDIAWAAGIFEGEGSVIFRKVPSRLTGRLSGSLNVSVIQKDTWLLYKLKDLFGGSVGNREKKSNCKRWHLSGPRAHGFMYTVFTWLSPRRRQQFRNALWTERTVRNAPKAL